VLGSTTASDLSSGLREAVKQEGSAVGCEGSRRPRACRRAVIGRGAADDKPAS
ncbi:hypothetical protein E2562_015684, partial [Oryza meyeriana var. granulata]